MYTVYGGSCGGHFIDEPAARPHCDLPDDARPPSLTYFYATAAAAEEGDPGRGGGARASWPSGFLAPPHTVGNCYKPLGLPPSALRQTAAINRMDFACSWGRESLRGDGERRAREERVEIYRCPCRFPPPMLIYCIRSNHCALNCFSAIDNWPALTTASLSATDAKIWSRRYSVVRSSHRARVVVLDVLMFVIWFLQTLIRFQFWILFQSSTIVVRLVGSDRVVIFVLVLGRIGPQKMTYVRLWHLINLYLTSIRLSLIDCFSSICGHHCHFVPYFRRRMLCTCAATIVLW